MELAEAIVRSTAPPGPRPFDRSRARAQTRLSDLWFHNYRIPFGVKGYPGIYVCSRAITKTRVQ